MKQEEIGNIQLMKFLFTNPKISWLWFLVRIFVGWSWLSAGWEKLGSPAWTGSASGGAIVGFVGGAINKMSGAHPDVSSWYGYFLEHCVLPHASLWAHLVAYGEVLVGIALIVGAFTGIAAFFGVFMNLNYLFAGTVSINPLLLVFGIFLVLAWRTAGFLGADYFLLPVVIGETRKIKSKIKNRIKK